MNKVLMVSPHFDDAVLSAGQFMAERPDCVVLTVFGGFPEGADKLVTPYDSKCGFKNALDAVSERRRENDAATALLRASKIDLDFPDSQYNQHVPTEEITAVLQRIVDGGDYEGIYAPIGIGHPDHEKVNDAVVALDTNVPIVFWEDIPVRVTEPHLVEARLGRLGIRYEEPCRTVFNRVYIADKMRALLCYGSQIGTGILDPYLMYVPERLYKYEKY